MAAALVLFGLLPSYVAILYLLLLAMARAWGFHDTRVPSADPQMHFLVLIPAHNEAQVLGSTLHSCQSVDYPSDHLTIVVVADNCQDATAEIARRANVRCLERHDRQLTGKGHALAWAFQQLANDPYDAALVLDADCRIDPQALRVSDAFFHAGDRVLQLNHRVLNPDDSPISYAAAVGRLLEYDLFYAPKSRFGWSVLLVGTGMMFHHSILQQFPWQSHSCAEDTEYTVQLTRAGVPVRFISNAHIGCRSVTTCSEMQIQRARWASGNLRIGKTQALRLLARGLQSGQWRQADLGWTLLLTSRPLVLLHLFLVIGAACVIPQLTPPSSQPTWGAGLVYAAGILPVLYACYFLSGVVALGVSRRRLSYLIQAPLVVAQLIKIALRALVSSRDAAWIRTPR